MSSILVLNHFKKCMKLLQGQTQHDCPRRSDLRRESAAARRSSSVETAAEPGMTPRSARHRAPRSAEKLGLAGEPGIVISAPASAAGARTRHTLTEGRSCRLAMRRRPDGSIWICDRDEEGLGSRTTRRAVAAWFLVVGKGEDGRGRMGESEGGCVAGGLVSQLSLEYSKRPVCSSAPSTLFIFWLVILSIDEIKVLKIFAQT